MTDDDLVEYYWSLRRAIVNAGDLACFATSRHGRQTAARGMDRNLRHLDICVAVARQRGLDLVLGTRRVSA